MIKTNNVSISQYFLTSKPTGSYEENCHEYTLFLKTTLRVYHYANDSVRYIKCCFGLNVYSCSVEVAAVEMSSLTAFSAVVHYLVFLHICY